MNREEYEKALEIVINYQNYMQAESKRIQHLLGYGKKLEDLFLQGEISTRFRNTVCNNLSIFIENKKEYTTNDLFKLTRTQILGLRNSGKANLIEFEKLKEKYDNI